MKPVPKANDKLYYINKFNGNLESVVIAIVENDSLTVIYNDKQLQLPITAYGTRLFDSPTTAWKAYNIANLPPQPESLKLSENKPMESSVHIPIDLEAKPPLPPYSCKFYRNETCGGLGCGNCPDFEQAYIPTEDEKKHWSSITTTIDTFKMKDRLKHNHK